MVATLSRKLETKWVLDNLHGIKIIRGVKDNVGVLYFSERDYIKFKVGKDINADNMLYEELIMLSEVVGTQRKGFALVSMIT